MKNRYVGVLLNRRLYEGIRSGKTGYETLLQYVRMGERYGVTPCFMRLQDIRPGCSKVSAYVFSNWQYAKKDVPMPSVVHNRAIYKGKRAQEKIRRIALAGTTVFNRCNRYGKWYIHKLLMEDDGLRSHLPETLPAAAESIREMMERHPSLIVKPDNGSVGKGIMLFEREEDGAWRLQYRSKSKTEIVKMAADTGKLPDILVRAVQSRRYIVQQRLPLAKYEGRPFDIRVSVQRDNTGSWQVAGMVGKAASDRSFLTNVAQGGQVYPLESILAPDSDLKPGIVRSDVTRFSFKVAKHLSGHLPDLADIGLDIGIMEDGCPMFIECNGRDLRYSLLNGGLLDEWTNTYGNPMGYASYLLDQKK